jgi:hypothetical protein
VQSVSDRVSAATWTAEVVMRAGRLPDPQRFARAVGSVGAPFTLRGIEVTVEGVLVEEGGRLALRIPATGQVLELVALGHKVQWDRRHEREQPATAEERAAYERLRAEGRQQPRRIQVVGPLVAADEQTPPVLEVRQYSWGDRS